MTERAGLGPGETVTTTEKWVVVWFPPDVPQREHGFASEVSARRFAAKDDIAAWAPLLDHRITTTMTVSELVPLEKVCGNSGGVGINAGHECRCVREKGHPRDSDRPHGCTCGALWAEARP